MKSVLFTSLLFTFTSAFAGLTPEEIAKLRLMQIVILMLPIA